MEELLSYHNLKLLYSRYRLVEEASDTFDTGLGEWRAAGDWHYVTEDTNADESLDINGFVAERCAGSYQDKIAYMEKEIDIKNYGEIFFEHYIQNNDLSAGINSISFFIDNTLKFKVYGPSPWQRCSPIGLTPGKHKLLFEYNNSGAPIGKKGIIDNIMVYEGKNVDCIITDYTPPKPVKNISANKTLRGYTRYQEMIASDAEINFTIIVDGINLMEFIQKSDEQFYFIDEFGTFYRGIFPATISPKQIALNKIYSIELSMTAGQKTGIGFC